MFLLPENRLVYVYFKKSCKYWCVCCVWHPLSPQSAFNHHVLIYPFKRRQTIYYYFSERKRFGENLCFNIRETALRIVCTNWLAANSKVYKNLKFICVFFYLGIEPRIQNFAWKKTFKFCENNFVATLVCDIIHDRFYYFIMISQKFCLHYAYLSLYCTC